MAITLNKLNSMQVEHAKPRKKSITLAMGAVCTSELNLQEIKTGS